MNKIVHKVHSYTVSSYTDTVEMKKFLMRYPQYQFEGCSFVDNADGTITSIVRYYRVLG